MMETEMIVIPRMDWQNLYTISGCLTGIILGVMLSCMIMLIRGDN